MSEETEVKSKQELIEKWESAIGAAEFYGKGKEEKLISYMKDFVSDLNQLDEPEVLSSDWIKDNQLMWTSIHGAEYYVPANKLYGKIVPKQIKPKELYKAITGISPSIEEVCDSSGTETFLDESVSVERIIEEIMKVFESSGSEITEEPETVASVIVDFSRSVTRLKEVLNMEVEELEE